MLFRRRSRSHLSDEKTDYLNFRLSLNDSFWNVVRLWLLVKFLSIHVK